MTNDSKIREWLARLLRARSTIGAKCNALDEFLGDAMSELFGNELTEIEDIVSDICGVPDERTDFEAIGIDTGDMIESQIEYGYCRDWIGEMLYYAAKEIDPRKDDCKDVDLEPFLEMVDMMSGNENK